MNLSQINLMIIDKFTCNNWKILFNDHEIRGKKKKSRKISNLFVKYLKFEISEVLLNLLIHFKTYIFRYLNHYIE